jgi:hypothetical protein
MSAAQASLDMIEYSLDREHEDITRWAHFPTGQDSRSRAMLPRPSVNASTRKPSARQEHRTH